MKNPTPFNRFPCGNQLKDHSFRFLVLSGHSIRIWRSLSHEFHYSDIVDSHARQQVETVYQVASRKGGGNKGEGFRANQTLGSYIHLHFGSSPDCGRIFADACRKYVKETGS